MDVCIFSAKSKTSGLLYKNFFDLLTTLTVSSDNGSIRYACFKISNAGMTIFSSSPKDVCVEANFRRKDFFNFFLDGPEICIGANLEFVKNFFRTAKKSYDVEFKVLQPKRDCFPSEMIIIIADANGKLNQTHRINIENIQNIEFNTSLTPTINPIQINKEDFNALKSIGTMNEGNGKVRITAGPKSATFFSDINSVASKSICIGDPEDGKVTYDELFHSNYIRNIHKTSAFSSFVKMYAVTKQPLLFETNIGDIGNLNLWVKPLSFDDTKC
jgi:hypothetical protein